MLHGVGAAAGRRRRSDVSFLDNRKYLPALAKTRAGAVIVHPDMAAAVPARPVPIVTDEP